ncbi:unnamed protein product [Somion occarium]|uniref:SEC7 domain-containing protein n=1 Tax=Somion occarium TaxID=3059160 RepID=A0ABP1DHV5_9APHY
MESSSVAEQRATAVAKLKRAASLPRMRDGRRPPMHTEAVSEGERAQNDESPDGEREPDSDEKPEERMEPDAHTTLQEEKPGEDGHSVEQVAEASATKDSDTAEAPPPERPTTPSRRRRSRARSRGSKDLRNKPQKPSVTTAESSADEYNPPAGGEDAPPSPPLISPIPSHYAAFQTSRLLRSPVSPVPPLFYPGTSPSTPMLPTLDEIQKGIGLYRSNSAGAARAMAMSKLVGGKEPVDMSFISQSSTPPLGRLTRNNTVAGGERIEARRNLLNRLHGRLNNTDGEVTSGGEECTVQATPPPHSKRRRRRSHRSSSRASTVLDDRDDREQPPSTPHYTPLVPPAPLALDGNTPSEPPWPPQKQNEATFEYESPMGGRGVLVEPEDDDLSPPKPYGLPATPSRGPGVRMPHASDAPSSTSTDSAPGLSVPVFISKSDASQRDAFPASPFATPLKEKPFGDGDEDEESDAYAELRNRMTPVTRNAFERDSKISWEADPLPRMPIHDDDDEDEDDEVPRHEDDTFRSNQLVVSTDRPLSPAPEDNSALSSPVSKEVVVEIETSPEPTPGLPPPSPFSAVPLSTPATSDRPTVAGASPSIYPMRLSVASRSQMERSLSATEFPDDEGRDAAPKRGGESTWERVKNSFITRTGSSNGRRSRTNSISARDRRYNTDSSISRESGASLGSAKHDKADGIFASQQGQQSQQSQQSPLMQTPSASGSILSLAPHPGPPLGGVSPIPPASSADLLKYTDSKLFPFPDIAQYANGHFNGMEAIPSSGSSSSATTRSPEVTRDRKLSHQVSDSQLLTKYHNITTPQELASVPSSGSHMDYFSIQPATTPTPTSGSGSLKLPMTREGVKNWLKSRMFPNPSLNSTPNTPSSPPVVEPKPRNAIKKPSLSDVLKGRRENDSSADWEGVRHDDSRTPTGTNGSAHPSRPILTAANKSAEILNDLDLNRIAQEPHPHTNPVVPAFDTQENQGISQFSHTTSDYTAFPSPPEPPSSTTPDPQSSLSEYPTRSTSESFSSMSSSRHSPDGHNDYISKAAVVMERLEEALGHGSKGSGWPSAIDAPPRKLVLSSPVLQVANANTVKDRFLFLFNDILVIAKPIMHDHDGLLDPSKPSPLDRKFIVKSVVSLRELKFSADRDESRTNTTASSSNFTRHPVIRSFVHQFTKDPDRAISALFEKSNTRDDPVALGQLVFRTIDIDRVQLGDYLARRTSKVVLKAFVDGFGFVGLRIDKALRVFLLSICVPPKVNALDYLLDTFASRWYEANARIVAYDKDLAIRLVRAIVQLNEVMHGGISQTPGNTGYPKRNVLALDFREAFRRFDPRGLVSDDLLDKIYASVRREKLYQARNLHSQTPVPEVTIIIKRPLPSRLTYRVHSDPIVLRIPQPDPQLTIQLFGQDLIFEPAVLNFAKSCEASFRVTGSSLGPKTIIMWRSGPNALAYSGLPLSSPVIVERAFMRSTFQLAFLNHEGQKRRYMFSVDDPLIRHPWTVSIQRQIDIAGSQAGQASKPLRAAEQIAFRVLQDTLIGSDVESHQSPVDEAFERLTGEASTNPSSRRAPLDKSPAHARSKSRSQVYHRHGAGKLEPESSDELDQTTRNRLLPLLRTPSRLWSGRDLEVICQQNSAIPSLIAYLLDVPHGASTNGTSTNTP